MQDRAGGAPALGLHLRVSLDSDGLAVVTPSLGRTSLTPLPSVKRGKPWKTVSRGSTVVKIYCARAKRHGRPQGPFTIAWRDSAHGHRQRAMRSQANLALAFADQKATELANGETWKQSMGANDYASYLRALELLARIGGPPLEVAVGIYTQCVQKLVGMRSTASVTDAVDFFLQSHPAGVASKNIPELVQDLLAARKQCGAKGKPVSDRWVKSLGKQLGRFASRFTGPLQSVGGSEIDTWLNSLGFGPQTRANYRGAVLSLVRYAKFKRCLPREWSQLDEVSAAKPETAEVRKLTPEQLTKLLHIAPQSLVPFIVVAAFAGVRHEEMTGKKKTLLDWSNVDFEQGTIYVPKGAAKTGEDRYVPMSENLAAWLLRYARPNGRICELKNSSNALTRAKRRAGIPTGRGQTRNTLRKSFISYQVAKGTAISQVAEEAGTSVGKIRKHYLRRAAPREAERWFAIWPLHADIVQQDFGSAFGAGRRKAS